MLVKSPPRLGGKEDDFGSDLICTESRTASARSTLTYRESVEAWVEGYEEELMKLDVSLGGVGGGAGVRDREDDMLSHGSFLCLALCVSKAR